MELQRIQNSQNIFFKKKIKVERFTPCDFELNSKAIVIKIVDIIIN